MSISSISVPNSGVGVGAEVGVGFGVFVGEGVSQASSGVGNGVLHNGGTILCNSACMGFVHASAIQKMVRAHTHIAATRSQGNDDLESIFSVTSLSYLGLPQLHAFFTVVKRSLELTKPFFLMSKNMRELFKRIKRIKPRLSRSEIFIWVYACF